MDNNQTIITIDSNDIDTSPKFNFCGWNGECDGPPIYKWPLIILFIITILLFIAYFIFGMITIYPIK